MTKLGGNKKLNRQKENAERSDGDVWRGRKKTQIKRINKINRKRARPKIALSPVDFPLSFLHFDTNVEARPLWVCGWRASPDETVPRLDALRAGI